MTLYDVTGCRAEYVKPDTNLTVWGAAHKPFALINGSLYDGGIQLYRRPSGPPVGTVLEDGKLVRQEGNYPGIGIRDGKLSFGGPWENAWQYFMAGYNCPLIGGVYNTPAWEDPYVFGSKNHRIGIGFTHEKKTVICVDDNVTLKQFAERAIAKGVITLVNLDGGGSRHLLYNNRLIYQSPRIPYNAIAFFRTNTETVNPCPFLEPTAIVRMWSVGEGAKWTQWQLSRHGYPCDTDGFFFTKSVNALKAFQTEHKLTADGVSGPLTREALRA